MCEAAYKSCNPQFISPLTSHDHSYHMYFELGWDSWCLSFLKHTFNYRLMDSLEWVEQEILLESPIQEEQGLSPLFSELLLIHWKLPSLSPECSEPPPICQNLPSPSPEFPEPPPIQRTLNWEIPTPVCLKAEVMSPKVPERKHWAHWNPLDACLRRHTVIKYTWCPLNWQLGGPTSALHICSEMLVCKFQSEAVGQTWTKWVRVDEWGMIINHWRCTCTNSVFGHFKRGQKVELMWKSESSNANENHPPMSPPAIMADQLPPIQFVIWIQKFPMWLIWKDPWEPVVFEEICLHDLKSIKAHLTDNPDNL